MISQRLAVSSRAQRGTMVFARAQMHQARNPVPCCARDDTAGVVADDAVSVTGENFLLYRNISDLNLRDLMVPLRGDAFKRQAKRRALTGAERGKAEVHCFRIRTVRL